MIRTRRQSPKACHRGAPVPHERRLRSRQWCFSLLALRLYDCVPRRSAMRSAAPGQVLQTLTPTTMIHRSPGRRLQRRRRGLACGVGHPGLPQFRTTLRRVVRRVHYKQLTCRRWQREQVSKVVYVINKCHIRGINSTLRPWNRFQEQLHTSYIILPVMASRGLRPSAFQVPSFRAHGSGAVGPWNPWSPWDPWDPWGP